MTLVTKVASAWLLDPQGVVDINGSVFAGFISSPKLDFSCFFFRKFVWHLSSNTFGTNPFRYPHAPALQVDGTAHPVLIPSPSLSSLSLPSLRFLFQPCADRRISPISSLLHAFTPSHSNSLPHSSSINPHNPDQPRQTLSTCFEVRATNSKSANLTSSSPVSSFTPPLPRQLTPHSISRKPVSEGVKTEFVFADGAKNDVQLSGDWNDWKAIQMFHEGAGTWSVVTPVPPGPHEFKFIVDGEWKHSERHPTIGIDETSLNNVRYVLPEPDLGGSDTTSTKSSSRPARRDSRASSASMDSRDGRKKKGGGFFSKK